MVSLNCLSNLSTYSKKKKSFRGYVHTFCLVLRTRTGFWGIKIRQKGNGKCVRLYEERRKMTTVNKTVVVSNISRTKDD